MALNGPLVRSVIVGHPFKRPTLETRLKSRLTKIEGIGSDCMMSVNIPANEKIVLTASNCRSGQFRTLRSEIFAFKRSLTHSSGAGDSLASPRPALACCCSSGRACRWFVKLTERSMRPPCRTHFSFGRALPFEEGFFRGDGFQEGAGLFPFLKLEKHLKPKGLKSFLKPAADVIHDLHRAYQ